MPRTRDIINHECLSREERRRHETPFRDKAAEARKTVPGIEERSIGRSTEKARRALVVEEGTEVAEEKKGPRGENKIKEENRRQFFTSFLKRGLGTRGASLNRFFQRGEGGRGREGGGERGGGGGGGGPIFLPSSCAKRRKLYLPPAVSPSSTVVARRPSLDWNLKFRYLARRSPLFFSPCRVNACEVSRARGCGASA